MQNINGLNRILIAGIATVILSGGAMAADAGGWGGSPTPPEKDHGAWDIAFGVTLASAYVADGIEYNDGLSVQPYVELTLGMFYLGYWGSNLNSALAASAPDSWEHDISVGIRPELGPLSLDIGYVHYIYDVSGDGGGEVDFKAEISPIERLTLGAEYDHGVGSNQGNNSAEVAASLDLVENFAASAAVGWVFGSAATPYTYWNAGLTWTPVEPLEIDFRYHNAPTAVGGVSKFVVAATLSGSLRGLGLIGPPPPPAP
jgi:uncharacterized protein (TIGR02001 family)